MLGRFSLKAALHSDIFEMQEIPVLGFRVSEECIKPLESLLRRLKLSGYHAANEKSVHFWKYAVSTVIWWRSTTKQFYENRPRVSKLSSGLINTKWLTLR